MDTVTRILFVCSGNICRSPLAEALLREELDRRGTNGRFVVDSAGTHADHNGQQADPRTRAVAKRRGTRIDHRARRLVPEDLARFDLVLAMDHGHLHALRRLARGGEAARRIVLFRSFDPEVNGAAVPDLPDPWYGQLRDFEHVHEIVARTCARIADSLVAGAETHAGADANPDADAD